jgi:exodeoxyribonuclease VIII
MSFKHSPLNYHYDFISGMAPPFKITDALILGSYVHSLLLEPETIEKDFVEVEKLDLRKNVDKAKKKELDAYMALDENKHKMFVSPELIESAYGMANAIRNEPMFYKLVNGSKIEKSIFFTHKSTGLQCKARPDAWNNQIVVDVKTTSDASYRGFQSSALKYGYFLQAGMIKEALKSVGIEMTEFVIPCVESKPPYHTAIYTMDDDALSYGSSLFNDLMERLAVCLERDEWESYGYQTLSVPTYAFYD